MTTPLDNARALRKAGEYRRALQALALCVNADQAGEDIEAAGRLLAKMIAAGEAAPELRVLLLGRVTTSWLAQAIRAHALAKGKIVDVQEGDYDNVLQTLEGYVAKKERFDAIVLVPAPFTFDDANDPQLPLWQRAWNLANTLGARVVQLGFDWIGPGPLGYHLSGRDGGVISGARRANAALRSRLPESVYFVDAEALSGAIGRLQFYDPRRNAWTRQPWSEDGTAKLGGALAQAILASIFGPKKVLAIDLDNTLWGGVVGEVGAANIEVSYTPAGESFRSFQRYVRLLKERGILLVAVSKNNPADAEEPFRTRNDLPLALSDFAAFEASWGPKSVALEKVARRLNLGLDAFVFFDDHPAEREEVRQRLPEVTVVGVPEDPSGFVRALEEVLAFESAAQVAGDERRSEQYREAAERERERDTFASIEAYLSSLEMKGDVRALDDADLPRVVQLLGKTNQFNLTTRRHSLAEVERLRQTPRSVTLTVRVADKFGDYGLIGVVLAIPKEGDPSCLAIDTWLMSCRVIGRSVEAFTLEALLALAKSAGYRAIEGQYIATGKNALVEDLFPRMGFRAVGEDRFLADLETLSPPPTFVRAKQDT